MDSFESGPAHFTTVPTAPHTGNQVTLVAVQSLDGCITRGAEPGVGFASEWDQAWFGRILKQFDAIIMGRRTYEPVRNHVHQALDTGSTKLRIVMTRRPADWQDDHKPGLLEFDSRPPAEIVNDLAVRGCLEIIVLGGSSINRLFLEAGLVDRVWLTLEPEIFGAGRRLVDGPVGKRFHFDEMESLGGSTILLKYSR
jgi:dihydrofolate reductase